MISEDYNLKWNEFEKNASNSFAKLRNETTFFDVTLVSNDQKQVSAHKLVLSACSDTFRTILSNNTTANMVLYLDSLDSMEVNLILDYIYQGEVNVSQERLDRFIQIAAKFKLDGLLANTGIKESGNKDIKKEIDQDQNDHDLDTDSEFEEIEVDIQDDKNLDIGYKDDKIEKDENQDDKNLDVYSEINKKEIDENQVDDNIDIDSEAEKMETVDNQDNQNLKTGCEVEKMYIGDNKENVGDKEDFNYEDYDLEIHESSLKPIVKIESDTSAYILTKIESSNADFESKFQELVLKEENLWQCTVCEKTMKQRIDIKRHLENHLSGLSFDCSMGDREFQTSQSLTGHRRSKHKSEIRKYHHKTMPKDF